MKGTTPLGAHTEQEAAAWVRGMFGSVAHRYDLANHLLSFSTDDLAGDMKSLRARGVSFLDYDLPDLKTEGGVAEFGGMKTAWCKDSEGNILGFVEGEM